MNRKPSIQNDAYRQPGSAYRQPGSAYRQPGSAYRQTGYERIQSQRNGKPLQPQRNEVMRAERSHLHQLQKENLGEGDSGEPIREFSSDYDTGSETGSDTGSETGISAESYGYQLRQRLNQDNLTCNYSDSDNDEVAGDRESNHNRVQRENLGEDHSDDSGSETGSDSGSEGWVNKLQFDDVIDSDDEDSDVTDSDDEYSTPPELENPVVQGPTRPRTMPRTMPRPNAFLDEGVGSWEGEASPPHRDWIGGPRSLYASK